MPPKSSTIHFLFVIVCTRKTVSDAPNCFVKLWLQLIVLISDIVSDTANLSTTNIQRRQNFDVSLGCVGRTEGSSEHHFDRKRLQQLRVLPGVFQTLSPHDRPMDPVGESLLLQSSTSNQSQC
jgi:hypothetical protein